MQKRVSRDAYGFISCLTAIDLEGNVLWQLGEPSDKTEELGKVSADMAFQVYDIDGDGRDEVIVGWDFEIGFWMAGQEPSRNPPRRHFPMMMTRI